MPTELLDELRQLESEIFEIEELPDIDSELKICSCSCTDCSCSSGWTT
jgi:hypothetical protein